MGPTRTARLLLLALVLALGLVAAPHPASVPEASAASPYELALYRPGDFVAQFTLYQCVGASMQMMRNMIGRNDVSAGTQRSLWRLAQQYSPPRPPDRPPRKGASVFGWAAGLNVLDSGPYRVVAFDTIDQAARAGAYAMRVTRKPVGLLVWGGRHAWVMSGFRATADPRRGTFRVTQVQVLDPLYPRTSPAWGPSPRPGAQLSLSTLGQDFVPRRRGWSGAMAGKFVIVMPVTRELGAVRDGMRWIVRAKPPGRPGDLGSPARPAAAPTPILEL